MIGKKLGRFEVVERVGAGGMGEIYRARHEELDLDVAVKVLPKSSAVDETARKLFHKEARTLAKLKHPHIGSIHDFGTVDGADYLVMELIPGADLAAKLQDGALPDSEVLRLGTQIAGALEEAHEKQIVHLDLKPKNIMVTPKGQAKVLDFGLAKLVRPIDEATTKSMAELRSVAGTLPYMAPEQLQDGTEVDARTDVYALGATLYEMATGRRPFEQTDANKLITAILQTAPARPRAIQNELPEDLERVVLKSLEKDPARRYQSVKELREDLERCAVGMAVSAPRPRPRWVNRWTLSVAAVAVAVVSVTVWKVFFPDESRTKVAVLPVKNLSGDPEQDDLAEVMTFHLISELVKLGNVSVMGYETAVRLGQAGEQQADLVKAFQVGAIMQATFTLDGDRVLISAELTETGSRQVLWADSFNRDIAEIVPVLNEVTASIARGVEVRLTPGEELRLTQSRAVEPKAYRAYAKGLHSLKESSEESIRKAIDFFTEAIEIDSEFAPAHAGLARCWLTLGDVVLAYEPWQVAFPKAEAAAHRALELEPSIAEAQFLLADIILEKERDWVAAEDTYRRSLDLNPDYAEGRLRYGQFLRNLGRYEEALEQMKLAQELDPLHQWIDANVMGTYAEMGRWDEALAAGHEALETHDDAWGTHWMFGLTYFWMGEFERAVSKLEQTLEMVGSNSAVLGWLARAYVRSGKREKAIKILEDLEALEHPPFIWIACVRADLGEVDVALDWLEKAYDEDPFVMLLAKTTAPSNLRSHPRFNELVEQLGIPSTRGDRLFPDG